MIDVEIFSVAGIGKINEDYVLRAEITPDVSLITVCDGMSGLSYGAEASRFIAQSIVDYMSRHYCTQTPEQSIVNAIFYANDELAKECIRLRSKMGASVALILFEGNRCYYTWLGDVRVYLIQGDKAELLTKDHLAIEGNHTFLSRCINGKEFRFSPNVGELAILPGNEILIATDGYYLHNDVGSPLESVITSEDDATIVRLKQT